MSSSAGQDGQSSSSSEYFDPESSEWELPALQPNNPLDSKELTPKYPPVDHIQHGTFGFRVPNKYFYVDQDYLGCETRTVEFKVNRPNSLRQRRRTLQDTIGKYVTSFLNTLEGGRLLFGVDDSGIVQGFVSMSPSWEVRVQEFVDEVIRTKITPSVSSSLYSINFCPVLTAPANRTPCPSSAVKMADGNEYKLMEVCVDRQRHPECLYFYRDRAFARRDNSTRVMRPTEIAMWEDMAKESYLRRLEINVSSTEKLLRKIRKLASASNELASSSCRERCFSQESCPRRCHM